MSAQVAPAKAPDIAGHWRAWKITTRDDERNAVSVGSYLTHTPGAHPFWSFHVVAGIALREMPGIDPSILHFPEATHEFLILALNPDHPVPEVDNWQAMSYLTPPNLVHQVALPSDAHAARVLDSIVCTIVKGVSPDSDMRSWWTAAIDATVAHECSGAHGDAT